jgi:hypothetical protein
VIAILIVWLGIYAYNQVTDGFSIRQMTSSLPSCPQFEVSLSTEKKAELQVLLDQKFYYLGKGCQFYVFESEDGKFVIKFLKHKHLRPFTWLNSIPMPEKWRAMSNAKIARRQERVERLFSSCKLAYEKMPHETGLLFIHLNRTPTLEKTINLFDKMGCKHAIDVDSYEYVIQYKAVTVKNVFSSVQEKDISARVAQLVNLVLARCEKGIGDRDRSFVQNVAFAAEDDRAIFVDIGQFYEEPLLMQKEEQQKDLNRRLNNLHYWTGQHFPHLVPFVNR